MIHKSTVLVGKLRIGDKIEYAEFLKQPKNSYWEVKTITYTKTGRIKINGDRALKATTGIYE